MGYLNVFRSLTGADSRLGFYTKETKDRIPEVPGCYAWFLPLWFYREDLDELMQIVGGVLDYEQEPEKEVDLPFTWESVKLRARRGTKIRAGNRTRVATWQKVLADDQARKALQQTLLEASLLMPPLYVGRTNNIKQRYLQHVQDQDLERNSFHSRFTECVKKSELKISVSDLLFVCIETPNELRKVLGDSDESEPNLLIEQILMQFCRPPFSIR